MGDSLKGKVAIVTGAGSNPGARDREPIGNGKAAAIVYAREGAKVIAVDLRTEAAEETKQMIEEEGGTCSIFQADVSRSQDCQAMAEECLKTYGRIDILHNNVGITPRKPGGILEVDEEDWDLVMNVNLKSVFNACRAVLPQMLKQGSGNIVNISSIGAVFYGYPRMLAMFIYFVSKAGVNCLTKVLAAELADKGIRVNAIMPGAMDTPMIYKDVTGLYGDDLEAMRRGRNESIPMKRMGEPWDVANASLFLVSDKAKYITGETLVVDGGLILTSGVR